jgi:hypothetical protein
MTGFGNSWNLVSSNVFITQEAHGYCTGYSTGLALTCLGIACSIGMVVLRYIGNKRRDAGKENGKLEKGEDELAYLGDEHLVLT